MHDGDDLDGLIVVGAGGFGREVLDLVETINRIGNRHRLLGVVDDGNLDEQLLKDRGVQLLGGVASVPTGPGEYVIAISDPQIRRVLSERIEKLGRRATVLVHPSATLSATVTLGVGSVVCAHVSVTTHISIGCHVQINPNCTVGHDSVLEDYVSVYPGVNVSGSVHLEREVTVGTGSAIIQGVRVGAGTFVGAGSVVTRDLPAGVVAYGSPARPVRDIG